MRQLLLSRRLTTLVGALALLAVAAPHVRAQQVDATEFRRCAAISDRGARVDCYDAVVARTAGPSSTDGVFLNFQVDKPAMFFSGDAPRYPAVLRNAGVQGNVLVTFVIDTLGHADTAGLRVLSSDHPLFAEAVRIALPGLTYTPAILRGEKVPVQVQQTFNFRQQNAPAAPR